MGRGVVRLARCIYEDVHGRRVKVQRGTRIEDRRFPPHTSLETLIQVRNDIEDRLAVGASGPTRLGTLAADVTACLPTIATPRARQTADTMLQHWIAAETQVQGTTTTFGALPRSAITSLQVRTALAAFGSRFAPKTVKELRRLLSWIYTTLDGAEARNPVRSVKGPRVRYDDARGIDYAIIERIFAAMPDRGRAEKGQDRPTVNLTKLRLRVMAYTGLHQSEVAKLRPRDLNLAHRRLWIHPRVKGAGADGAWHALTEHGIAALRAFAEAPAFGPFSTRSMATSWGVAVAHAKAAWQRTETAPWPLLADARPYDLRHSFGTAVYLSGGDIRAAQEMLRHRQGSTTDRYTRAGVTARVSAAALALDAFLPRATPTDDPESVTNRPPMAQRAARLAETRGKGSRPNSAKKARK